MSQKESKDALHRIKYIAFCRAHSPPGEDATIRDLVNVAKHYLCTQTRRLWKDPLWDEYTDEEILVEYYAWVFSKNTEAKEEFEAKFAGTEEVYDWLDRMVDEAEGERSERLDEFEDEIGFKPDSIGD